jgi:hypothetical protein
MSSSIKQEMVDRVKAELGELDREFVHIDGKPLKPSQCYQFHANPTHVLFNTNCPDTLKERVNAIIAKYILTNESGA